MNLLYASSFILCTSLLTSCYTASNQYNRNTGITHGTVQLHLQKGVTTQTQVLNTFGSPNIATTDGDFEVWTYQRTGVESRASQAGGTIIFFGASSASSYSNSRTMTLIIKFGPTKRVVEFNSRYSSF